MKRRKVGNMLGLAVLSALLERPMHPYEMASVLRERGKDADLKIKWGSLYTVVGNLEKHGFVAAVGSVRDGGRPERTIYRLTEAGRAELEDWVAELLGEPDLEPTKFRAGLSIMASLGPDEVVALLATRLAALDERIAQRSVALEAAQAQVPRLFLVEGEYELALLRAEAEWVRGLRHDLTSGALPGVAAWRHYRETGELPEDLTAFAEGGQG
ncbi:PadR family transcriptional regulator [Amycolatopsis sp. FDAARGOS 1241]|uniref:PadR family transcriptional regulator n=1 Tax=Amycolatopsis sp. FDAARGOS 1241 TaxID=2778070 RepID=UPI001950F857|nr:PadR family transcriptional regulator [Amycolatopsis sp. FDAARGOS 1241]QRP45941.1 PadR family transcriptional regulator [Amycolatopsis sp. FDAARGOS 1241]